MTELKSGVPTVVRMGCLSGQVCVPKDFTDKQTIDFLESEHSCGTSSGWFIDEELGRVQCEELEDHVHIVLTA